MRTLNRKKLIDPFLRIWAIMTVEDMSAMITEQALYADRVSIGEIEMEDEEVLGSGYIKGRSTGSHICVCRWLDGNLLQAVLSIQEATARARHIL